MFSKNKICRNDACSKSNLLVKSVLATLERCIKDFSWNACSNERHFHPIALEEIYAWSNVRCIKDF